MPIDTDFIDEVMLDLERTYKNLLKEDGLPDTPLIEYGFYLAALGVIKEEPLDDISTQESLLLCLRLRLEEITNKSELLRWAIKNSPPR